MNICGCLVHVAPARMADARPAIAALAGVEIHAAAADGRLVVTVEDAGDRYASDTIMAIHQIPGVLSLTLNTHHFEDVHAPRAAHAASQPET